MSYGYGYGGDESGPPQGLDLGRIIRYGIGLLIALFGIVAYSMKTQVNPVTGQKQHVDLSVDQEKALGLQAAPEMIAKMGGQVDPRIDRRAAVVAEVGSELVRRSDAMRSPYVGNFHFYLLKDPQTINAFALPGGQVFITSALYEKLANEGQLAGVLGHEIGHVINRHSAQQMAKGQLGKVLAGAVAVGASGDRHGGQATAAAMMADQMLQLKFGRGDESQADHYGLIYMAEAGYDPTCMLDVMRILKEASGGGRQPEFLSTHPLPETRLREIEAEIHKMYPDGIPARLSKGRSLPHLRSLSAR
jgi:predicted Zn-dependent protease